MGQSSPIWGIAGETSQLKNLFPFVYSTFRSEDIRAEDLSRDVVVVKIGSFWLQVLEAGNPQILDVHFQIWLTVEYVRSLVEFRSVTPV